MQLKKRLKAIFAKPKRKLVTLMPEFRQLCEDLKRMAESRDSLTDIVHFFDTMSRWHDRGIGDLIAAFEEVNYGQYDEVLEKLRTLQKHFANAGRDEYGWNRTKRGETVTADKVFLGNIYGLFTHPVHFWQQRNDEKKGGWGYSGMEHLNAYDVVSQQARKFMSSHIIDMVELIKGLAVAV
ncbi:MAG: hypothetical protein Q8N73_01785 [bacterium]|nr:hypothetical protein [bacterium]